MADGPPTPFDSTLLQFGPPGTHTLTTLSGGLINETVRATCKHESIILKYAPPYIAAKGPSAPFGRERQSVEAAALSLFTPWQDGSLAHIGPDAGIFVPSSLLFDEKNHVLCLTDFGPSVPLTDFLTSASPGNIGHEHAAEVGARMGTFFAKLHSPSVFKLVEGSEAGKKILENASFGRTLVRDMIIAQLESIMLGFRVASDEAKALADAVARSWDEADRSPNATFVLGDSWTGSILLRTEVADRRRLQIALIDWEFATFYSNGVCNDVAAMLAHIRLRSIAAKAASDASTARACEVLSQEMARLYRSASLEESAPWAKETNDAGDVAEWERMARGVCLAIGRDMIYNASELEWDCTCCGPASGDKECALKTSMAQEGVYFLQRGTRSTLAELQRFVEGAEVLKLLLGKG